MNATNWPATVRDLGDMAAQRGMRPSDLLGVLEREFGPMPMPPEGYRLTKAGDRWIGEDIVNRGWILTPAWKFETGHCINVWTVQDRDLTPTEALELGAALIAAAQAAGIPKSE